MCDKKFVRKEGLKKHLTKSSPMCGEALGEKFTRGNKSYKCTVCGQRFSRKDGLKNHLTKSSLMCGDILAEEENKAKVKEEEYEEVDAKEKDVTEEKEEKNRRESRRVKAPIRHSGRTMKLNARR